MENAPAVVEAPIAVVIEGEAGEVIARSRAARVSYTPDLADHICTLVAEGWPLKEVLALEGFPAVGTFYGWLANRSGFREAYESARRVRALILEDDAEAILGESPGSLSEVTWAGKRFDATMKLCEVKDPTRYGKKVTVGGDADRPIVFKLITGVPPPTRAHIELNADGTIRAPLPDIDVSHSVQNVPSVQGTEQSPGSSEARAPDTGGRPEDAGSTPASGTP